MAYLTLGQLNIPIVWLAFFCALLYSEVRGRKSDGVTNKFLEHIVFAYIVVWKLSYVLFSWEGFVKMPLSLLYFDGGLKGQLLALVVVLAFLYKRKHELQWQTVWLYWVRFVGIYSAVVAIFQEQWIPAIIWGFLLIVIERQYSHFLYVGQFLMLVLFSGFSSILTLIHVIVLVTICWQTRKVQLLAMSGVLALVALLIGNIEQTSNVTVRNTIELQATTGEVYPLDEELTVVNFFATWCPPCKAEMPHLQSFAENLPAGVELVGVNLTARDNGQEALVDFMQTYEVSYPILLDEFDEVGQTFHILSIPTTVLLNSEGEEIERIVGPVSEEALRKIVKKHQSFGGV